MNTKRTSGLLRHSLAALTLALALAGTNIAGAAALSAAAADSPIPLAEQTVDAWHNVRTLDNSPSMSVLETSTKWRSNSFNIAGSRDWSKLIVFTKTSINLRLPIN
jgi:hypothetical protein